jgi:Ca2+-binding EF-hand superfamily protein
MPRTAARMNEIDHTTPPNVLRARFEAMDLNRDGKVSYEEFRAWLSLGR